MTNEMLALGCAAVGTILFVLVIVLSVKIHEQISGRK